MRGSSWFDKADDAIFTVSGSTVNALLVALTTALLVENAYPGALMGPLHAFVNPSPRYQQARSAVRETISIPESRMSASFADLWNDAARPDWPNWQGYKRVQLISPLKSPPQIAAAPPTQVAATTTPPKRVNSPRQHRPVVLARPNTPPYPPSGYGGAPGGSGFGFGFR